MLSPVLAIMYDCNIDAIQWPLYLQIIPIHIPTISLGASLAVQVQNKKQTCMCVLVKSDIPHNSSDLAQACSVQSNLLNITSYTHADFAL